MSSHTKPVNIYVIGAQSTGKTTIVNAIENHFRERASGPRIITEVARTVLQQYNYTADDITSSAARALTLQQLILGAQVNAERAASDGENWFVSDRSGVDPIIYTKKYVGEDAADNLARSQEWTELRDRMRKSLIIVCEAGGDWLVNDGVRLMPENRREWVDFHKLFCSCLDEWGLIYHVIPYNLVAASERVAFVLEKWKAH